AYSDAVASTLPRFRPPPPRVVTRAEFLIRRSRHQQCNEAADRRAERDGGTDRFPRVLLHVVVGVAGGKTRPPDRRILKVVDLIARALNLALQCIGCVAVALRAVLPDRGEQRFGFRYQLVNRRSHVVGTSFGRSHGRTLS